MSSSDNHKNTTKALNPFSKAWFAVFAGIAILCIMGIFRECAINRSSKYVANTLSQSIAIRLAPNSHSLSAKSSTVIAPSRNDSLFFRLHTDLHIDEIIVNHDTLHSDQIDRFYAGNFSSVLYQIPISSSRDSLILTTKYHGNLFQPVKILNFSHDRLSELPNGTIDTSGVFLSANAYYYPQLENDKTLHPYIVSISVPNGWKAISEGTLARQSDSLFVFNSETPLDGATIVAGPYHYRNTTLDNIEVGMYYYAETDSLVDDYLQQAKRYLQLYQQEIGPYPYMRFSIVESWFPAGYGFPSFTLLGSTVIRLPFIIRTSLGHEIAHNWLGNGIFVDYSYGNWCEGLTTHLADHKYKSLQSPASARAYRRDLLKDYSEYVVRGTMNDFPLSQFVTRTSAGSRAIGYGKSMMLFHMLEKHSGTETFRENMRTIYQHYRFKRLDFKKLITSFFTDNNSGNAEIFFDNWVLSPGAPELKVLHPQHRFSAKRQKWILEFDLKQIQKGISYTLDVPVRISFREGSSKDFLLRNTSGKLYHARIELNEEPIRLFVDPDYDLFRILDLMETPASIGTFLDQRPKRVYVELTKPGDIDFYRDFVHLLFGDIEIEFISSASFKRTHSQNETALFIGHHTEIDKAQKLLFSSRLTKQEVSDRVVAAAFRDANDPTIVHLAMNAENPEFLEVVFRKLVHYRKYSYLTFSGTQNRGKGQWDDIAHPLSIDLTK